MNKKFMIIFAAIMVIAISLIITVAIVSKNKANGDEPESTIEQEETTEVVTEIIDDTENGGFNWNGHKEVWAILPTTGVPGLMIHADSMGYTMEKEGFKYVTKDAKGEPAKQVAFVEDAIAAGNVGALMIAAMDTKMMEDVVVKAQDAGIAVVMLGAEPEGYQVNGCLYTAYEITGMFAVQAAEDWAKVRASIEGSNVPVRPEGTYEVAIDYYTDIADGIYRSNAMIGTIEKAENLVLVSATQAYGNSAQTTAYDNAKAVLAAHPNCRIFIAYEPDEAMGIASAIADYAEQNKLSLEDFCVVSCYAEDDTFMKMWKEAKKNPAANAIKGYATYGEKAMDFEIKDFKENGHTATGMDYSDTGKKLAMILLGSCNINGYSWAYGSTYYDSISATNVYGFSKEWRMGDLNPAIEYKVPEFIG